MADEVGCNCICQRDHPDARYVCEGRASGGSRVIAGRGVGVPLCDGCAAQWERRLSGESRAAS